DNNPGRVAASRYFRSRKIPVIFAAVSRDGDHGYVFVQEAVGPCIACVFPDIGSDDHYACPGTPAIADILIATGGCAGYAVDTLLLPRPRQWNYRCLSLRDGTLDGVSRISARLDCPGCQRGQAGF